MKKTILILTGIVLLSISSVFAQTFTTEMKTIFTDPESSSARLQHIKSAVDSKGNLYVVFTANANQSYFGTNRNGEWKFQPLVYFNTEYNEDEKASNFPNIAIDKNDNISIVIAGRYKENIYWETKHVSKCNEKWQFNDAAKVSGFMKFRLMDEYSDMCVDKDGGLHLYCCANVGKSSVNENWMSATYFYKAANSNKWQMEMIMPGIADKISYAADPSITTTGNKVFVTIGGSKNLHFASKDISGSKWHIEDYKAFAENPEIINTWKFETSITTDPKGNPIWAFYEYSGESEYNGINILSKNLCGSGKWKLDHSIDNPIGKRAPAIAVNNKGKTYLAFGGNSSFSLYAKTCNCKQTWEKIYEKEGNNTDYTDIIIDKKNVVSVFYTSVYDNKLYLLTVKETGVSENCNYPPVITGYSGKTNVAPGEEWTGTIKASDPECDKIDFYTIIKPDNFTIIDNGNGTATIKAKFPEGNGTGDPGITIWARDKSHQDIDGKVSAITFKLRLTPEGKEKGKIKVENKCSGSNTVDVIDEGSGNTDVNGGDESGDANTGDGGNADCEKFLKRYEAFADDYVPIIKKVKANPTDMDAVNKLAELMTEFESYSSEWVNLYDCHKIPGYQKRYDAATMKIQDANK